MEPGWPWCESGYSAGNRLTTGIGQRDRQARDNPEGPFCAGLGIAHCPAFQRRPGHRERFLMPRKPINTPLRVLLNNRLAGRLLKEPGGGISFQYAESWLSWSNTFPISMSLPLREDGFKGERVVAVFENLLPDSEDLRQRVAAKVGAKGIDAYSLLFQIGRDCAGALQFLPDDDDAVYDTSGIKGEPIDDEGIERLLKNLVRAPLGLGED